VVLIYIADYQALICIMRFSSSAHIFVPSLHQGTMVFPITLKIYINMSDTKVYQFGETGGSLNSLLPFLQQKGIDPAYLAGLVNNNGGGFFGNNAWEGIIALIVVAAIFGNGNGNGLFGGGNSNSAEREMLMSAIQRNGVDLSQLAQSINCSNDRLRDAIGAVSTQICNFAGQNGLSFQQVINSILTSQNAISAQLAECCCKTQSAILESNYLTERGFCSTNQIVTKGFSDIGYAFRDQTCSIEKAISDSTAQILAGQAAIEKRELQREIASLQDERQTYKLGNMIAAATGPIAAELESIKCKLPKTEVIPASPEYVAVNRSINVGYAPYYGCGTGYGTGWGWNGGSLWG
jgi:hypothetical protein